MTRNDGSHVSLEGVNPGRLFLGSCLALISTAVSFAVIGDIMGPLKSHFALTNTDVGYIGGAGLWGFTISMFLLGALVDAIGMGKLIGFAFLCHIAGPAIMMTANGFTGLFWGALVISLGNGTVEAVCNPLVATIYPTRKTERLNHFHMWFPGGIVIGGLLCFLLAKGSIASWQARLLLIVAPTILYGLVFMGQKVPATERVQSGLSFGEYVQCDVTAAIVSRTLLLHGHHGLAGTGARSLDTIHPFGGRYCGNSCPGLYQWTDGCVEEVRGTRGA